MDKENRKYTQRLFQFLTMSSRPLRTGIEELAEILVVQFNATVSLKFNEDLGHLDAEAVLSTCSSLVYSNSYNLPLLRQTLLAPCNGRGMPVMPSHPSQAWVFDP